MKITSHFHRRESLAKEVSRRCAWESNLFKKQAGESAEGEMLRAPEGLIRLKNQRRGNS